MIESNESNESKNTKRYVNVCFVGHVMNGKTTLVKALTNVNTKKHSKEIKSGRTVKLGYANCLVWKCESCQKIMTTGQSSKSLVCCNKKVDEPVQYLSFLDAPGHHSLIHNMIKGTAIVDCAILVTDVRKDKLQIQTLEHLAILETLDIKNIIIVQNKSDLANIEQIQKHYKLLKTELKETIAENAPVIPISAQSGMNVDVVKKYLYEMVKLIPIRVCSKNVFSVIRSFDINKPGVEIMSLRGGVLGIVPLNSGYKVGDILEIRPGFIRKDGTNQVLKTKIESIFSENDSCENTVRGGLYGVGTKLDPTLTKNDGLVGCLVGFSKELPEVINKIDMKVVQLKRGFSNEEIPKIKEKTIYKLIIGSIVIQAMCVKKEKKLVVMKLLQPICTVENRCLIYTCESSNTQLIGFGSFGEEKQDLPQVLPLQTEEEYLTHLPKTEEEKTKEKTSIPIPVIARENKNNIWTNMSMFCQTIHRQEGTVVTYLQKELCMSASVCANGLRMYKTKISSQRLQKVLRNYVVSQVLCSECKNINTVLNGKQIVCLSCGSEKYVLE